MEGEHECTIVFAPDHGFPYFQQVLEIKVPNQKERCAIRLKVRTACPASPELMATSLG